MGKVKTQTLCSHQRALLGYMRAENLAQRCVQQVSGRVIQADGATTGMVYLSSQHLPNLDFAGAQLTDMRKSGTDLLCIGNFKLNGSSA